MGVTEVVRGADLLDSTPRQMYLYHLLGLRPPVFYHVPLLLTSDGRRLSKRDADAGLDDLQKRCSAGKSSENWHTSRGVIPRPSRERPGLCWRISRGTVCQKRIFGFRKDCSERKLDGSSVLFCKKGFHFRSRYTIMILSKWGVIRGAFPQV